MLLNLDGNLCLENSSSPSLTAVSLESRKSWIISQGRRKKIRNVK